MAQVTGMTAAEVEAELGSLVVSGRIDPGSNHLLLTTRAGGVIDGGAPAAGITDHGQLTGLGDDDHPQYHTDGRGDARYYTKAQVDAKVVTDHGALAGLADDDHPQYLTTARGDARYALDQIISQKTVTQAPSTYPMGLSIFEADASGWPAGDFSTVTTVVAASDGVRTFQINIHKEENRGAFFRQIAPGSNDIWGAWTSLTPIVGKVVTGTHVVNTPLNTQVSFPQAFPAALSSKVMVLITPQTATNPQQYSWGVDSVSNTGFTLVSTRNTGSFTLTFGWAAYIVP